MKLALTNSDTRYKENQEQKIFWKRRNDWINYSMECTALYQQCKVEVPVTCRNNKKYKFSRSLTFAFTFAYLYLDRAKSKYLVVASIAYSFS
ncbi:MAG: hypothetical protein AAFP82_07870 [Bacteroidota bacterium]